jgi:hypothetical protein
MKDGLAGNPHPPDSVLGDAMHRGLRAVFLLPVLSFGVLAAPALRGEDPQAQPLPELRSFLDEVRARLHSDDFLLEQYTFTEKQTQKELDSSGNVKKVSSSRYEVYPSAEPGHTYRRLIERDGKPLSSDELAKEDRKQESKEAKRDEKLGGEDESRRAANEAERRRKETEVIDEVFRVYDIRMDGRETLDGRGAIVLDFEPKPGIEATTRGGKILRKFAGRAWIDEEDRQLVRVEAQLIDDLSIGFGLVAKLKKGTHAEILRRKVNDEIWLPAEARFVGHGRLFLVKGLHIDALSEYSDYRKFTVATASEVHPDEPN